MTPDHSNILTQFSGSRLTLLIGTALLLVGLFVPAITYGQAKKPISKDGLIRAIRLNGLSTRELVEIIQQRGVEFQVTPEIEAEMRAAGARPDVIEAARSNYRPGRSSPGLKTPVSKNEIITALQNGAQVTRVTQSVRERGVDFRINPQIAREIRAVGGTPALIAAINSSFSGAKRPPMPRGTSYDDLIEQAMAAESARDGYRATRLLQQAISIDSSQPRAFQLLGYTQLYIEGNIMAAEPSMRAAIERGGSGVFRVLHNHLGDFNTYCTGSLFVTKSDVTFKADDGRDTFAVNNSDIKEIKMNRLGGMMDRLVGTGSGNGNGSFHIRPKNKINGRSNYDFAPATKQKAEALLVINLVKGYQQSSK